MTELFASAAFGLKNGYSHISDCHIDKLSLKKSDANMAVPIFFYKSNILRTDVHLQKTLLRTIFSFFQTPAVHFLYAQSNTPEDGRQHKIFYLYQTAQKGTCRLPCLHFSRTMERRIEEDNLKAIFCIPDSLANVK